MNCIHFSNAGEPSLTFKDGFPDRFEGPIINGAEVKNFQDQMGQMVIQQIITKDYAIRHTIAKFFNKIMLNGITNGEGLYCRIMRRNTLRHQLTGIGNIKLHDHEFMLIKTGAISGSTTFLANKNYETFDCWYSEDVLKKITTGFPSFNDLMAFHQDKEPLIISGTSKTIDKKAAKVITEILEHSYTKELLKIYFEIKLKELLLILLSTTFKEPKSKPATPYQLEAVHKAREIILSKPVGHYTIPQIARMVALNESDLKRIYRQVFDMGLFETYHEKAMQTARELVIGTDKPFKEIAGIAGFNHTTNFSSAFKKRYGETLLECRRNR